MLKHLRFGAEFKVWMGNSKSQAATMVLEPGGAEGGPENNHRGADQWLYVVRGSGEAKVGRKTHQLKAGSLLLIPRGRMHQIRNTGRTNLETLNFYVPPAYTPKGDTLPAGRPK